jgi:hypothetical protein
LGDVGIVFDDQNATHRCRISIAAAPRGGRVFTWI